MCGRQLHARKQQMHSYRYRKDIHIKRNRCVFSTPCALSARETHEQNCSHLFSFPSLHCGRPNTKPHRSQALPQHGKTHLAVRARATHSASACRSVLALKCPKSCSHQQECVWGGGGGQQAIIACTIPNLPRVMIIRNTTARLIKDSVRN